MLVFEGFLYRDQSTMQNGAKNGAQENGKQINWSFEQKTFQVDFWAQSSASAWKKMKLKRVNIMRGRAKTIMDKMRYAV